MLVFKTFVTIYYNLLNQTVPSLAFNQVDNAEVHWLTLSSNVLVVQVVEVSRLALVEDSLITQSQETIVDGPTGSVDGTSLWWWTVELELSVGNNGTDSSLSVSQHRARKSHGQRGRSETSVRNGGVVFGLGFSSGLGSRRGSSGLDLTVSDLRNDSSNSGGSLVLDLTVADLVDDRGGGDSSCGGLVLDLAITNLVDDRDSCHSSGSGGSLVLDLTVADLVNDRNSLNSGSGGSRLVLDLAISNLVDDRHSGGSRLLLDLAIADLVDNISLGSSCRRQAGKSHHQDTELGSVVSGGSREGCGRSQKSPDVGRDGGC